MGESKAAQTQFANDIDATEKKEQCDSSCKVLLAEKSILARILKECTDEFKDVDLDVIEHQCIESEPQISTVAVHREAKGETGEEKEETGEEKDEDEDEEEVEKEEENEKECQDNPKIEGSSTEDSSVNEGLVRYDIRFNAAAPNNDTPIHLIINVEAQNKCKLSYPLIKRGEYYGSRMISAQYGTKFKKSHYERIQKVYSIWICLNPIEDRVDSINKYEFCEKHVYGNYEELRINYDLMCVVMVNLGNENSANDVIRMLSSLFSKKVKKEEKKRILEEDFGIPMTYKMEKEVETMYNLSEGFYEEGKEEGKKEGKEEGKEEGKKEGDGNRLVKDIASLMQNCGWCESKAMDALNVSSEKRPEISARLHASFN